MSDFSKKILSGKSVTEEDWNQYLVEMHKRAPSMTPLAYAKYTASKGKNSYEILAQSLDEFGSKSIVLLDLACGDGHLIPYCLKRLGKDTQIFGIDMSEGELAVARKNHINKNIRFECARAQNLPLNNASVDAILCHMAFMLMVPLEPVVTEINRVLNPGGLFAAVVGNEISDPFLAKMRTLLSQFIKDEFPDVSRNFKYGDERVRSLEGLKKLFNRETGFSGVEKIEIFELEIKTGPEGVWDLYKDVYTVTMLPSESQEKLKTALIGLAGENADTTGNIHFKFPMSKFLTRKI